MLRHVFLAIAIVAATLAPKAQTIAQATQLIEDGDYAAAIETLQAIMEKKPKDAEAPYTLGTTYLGLGDNAAAQEAFLVAKKNGSRDALYQLAELELLRYEIEQAETYIADYRKALKKAKKGTPDLSANFDSKLDRISSMLDRVEKAIALLEDDARI